jgi:nucleotide-binding universal stress UspA family protein
MDAAQMTTAAAPEPPSPETPRSAAPRDFDATLEAVIAVGLDGRQHDRDALALAARLKLALGGRLVLAHVIPPPPLGRLELEYAKQSRHNGLELLAKARIGAPSKTRLLEAWPPAYALKRLAEDERANTVVVASSHQGAFGRIVPGSTASHLLAHAPCAVAVAPVNYAKFAPSRISALGVAYDVTPEADRALTVAAGAARVLAVPLRLYHATHSTPDGPGWDEYRRCMHEVAQAILDAGLRTIPSDVKATARVLEGHTADVIAHAARCDGIDLLYVGCRGYGPVREALFGGVAGGLLQTSWCPLVIVPRDRSHGRGS